MPSSKPKERNGYRERKAYKNKLRKKAKRARITRSYDTLLDLTPLCDQEATSFIEPNWRHWWSKNYLGIDLGYKASFVFTAQCRCTPFMHGIRIDTIIIDDLEK